MAPKKETKKLIPPSKSSPDKPATKKALKGATKLTKQKLMIVF